MLDIMTPLTKRYKSITGHPNALAIYAANTFNKIAVAEKNDRMMFDAGKGMVGGGCLRLEASGLRVMHIRSCVKGCEQYSELHPEIYDNDFNIKPDEMRNVRLALGLYFMGCETDGRLEKLIKNPQWMKIYNAYRDAIGDKLDSCLNETDYQIIRYYYEFALTEDELLTLRNSLDLDALTESWLTKELVEFKVYKLLYRGKTTVDDVLGRQ